MTASTKVFIYNGLGASALSADDLQALLTSNTIFSSRPDIKLCDFNFNAAGLSKPLFVVPGGSTSIIGNQLKPKLATIEETLGKHYHYLGICAGAFIGTHNADLFITSHKQDTNGNQHQPPSFFMTTQEVSAELNLLSDFKAIGSFYPNDSYLRQPPKKYMSYRVNVNLSESGEKLAQLYVAGPGFVALNKEGTNQHTEVVASYAERDSYTFPYENSKVSVKQFPAIIRQLPTEKQGGVFLSGTHIESCVKNSAMLGFFKQASTDNAALNDADYRALEAEQDKSRMVVEQWLKGTFR